VYGFADRLTLQEDAERLLPRSLHGRLGEAIVVAADELAKALAVLDAKSVYELIKE
jgi:hypothetical protein